LEAVFIILAVAVIIYFFRKSLKKPFLSKEEKYQSIDDRYNEERRNRELEIDSLLSKMGKNGIKDLSEKDRKRLEELSKK
jgi:hypothetical protein